jgi:AcrR family transcriptional regulator
MTKKESKDKRTNDILDAAIIEFVEKGYEATSIDSIAERAGLTKGGIYYHFSSKDDILIKANERFMEPVIGFMVEASNELLAAAGLVLYIEKYLTYWMQHPREMSFIFLTFTKIINDKNLFHIYDGYTEQMIGFFDGMYQKGIASGEFRSFISRSASTVLMAALDGIIGYLVLDSRLSLQQTISDFINTFINPYKERIDERQTR